MKVANSKDIIIGYKLKQLRIHNGYTQSKIAEFLEVSPQHYGTLERGVNSFSLDNIIKLCDFYKIPLVNILSDISSTDKKNRKEGEQFLQQVDSLNKEHKLTIKHMVEFYKQLENQDKEMQEDLKETKRRTKISKRKKR